MPEGRRVKTKPISRSGERALGVKGGRVNYAKRTRTLRERKKP